MTVFTFVIVFTFNVLSSYPAFCFGVDDTVNMFFFSFDYHKTKFRQNFDQIPFIQRIVFQHNFDIVSHFAAGTLRIAKTEAALDDLSLCFVSGLPAVYDKSYLTTSHIDTSSHCTSSSKHLNCRQA